MLPLKMTLKMTGALWWFFKVTVMVQVAEGHKATHGLRNSQVKEASMPLYFGGARRGQNEKEKWERLPRAAHGDRAPCGSWGEPARRGAA